MAKKEQKNNLESGKSEQGKKSSTKTPKNEGELSSPKRKKLIVGLLVVLLIAVALGVAFILMNKDSGESGEVTEEPALSYSEEIQQYSLPDDATQEHTNTKNLRIAWAYYWEENYSASLDFLDKIVDPEENLINSYNKLYGLSLSAVGKTEEAQKYTQATFEVREEALLADSEGNPGANYYLGELYAGVGQVEKATKYYQAFLDVFENIPVEAREYTPGYELVESARTALEELQ